MSFRKVFRESQDHNQDEGGPPRLESEGSSYFRGGVEMNLRFNVALWLERTKSPMDRKCPISSALRIYIFTRISAYIKSLISSYKTVFIFRLRNTDVNRIRKNLDKKEVDNLKYLHISLKTNKD